MFNNLIESKAAAQRTFGGMVASVITHAALISAAVYGTLHASQAFEKPKQEDVKFVQVAKKEPPPPKEQPKPPPQQEAAPPPPKGFQVITNVIKIPDVLPNIDLNKKITDEADFSGKGVASGIAKGVIGGAPVNTEQTFFEFQVEKTVQVIAGMTPPHYPDALRSANIEGEVVASFVVDTTGRADMSTFKIIKSTHDQFTTAVRNALVNYRYYPAEIGGRKVKQLVQQPFLFSLTGR